MACLISGLKVALNRLQTCHATLDLRYKSSLAKRARTDMHRNSVYVL